MKVTIENTFGDTATYDNIDRLEEERNYDNVVAIRLYDSNGLRAMVKTADIKRLDTDRES